MAFWFLLGGDVLDAVKYLGQVWAPARAGSILIVKQRSQTGGRKLLGACGVMAALCSFAAMSLSKAPIELLFGFDLPLTELRDFVSIAANPRATPLASMVLRGVVEIEHA
jgi:hypothetical protein